LAAALQIRVSLSSDIVRTLIGTGVLSRFAALKPLFAASGVSAVPNG